MSKTNIFPRTGLMAAVVVISALAAPRAMAKDPCTSLMCLAGEAMGKSGGADCGKGITDYFSIVKFGKHGFDAGKTSKARGQYLDRCASDSSGSAKSVNDKYGRQQFPAF
jgi:hypothetical protein